MPKKKYFLENLIGKRINKLTILHHDCFKDKHEYVIAMCDCGTKKSIQLTKIMGNKTRSCGCSFIKSGIKKTKHNCTNTRLYNIWRSMLARCKNKNRPEYKYYGGRGISIQDTWLDFNAFKNDVGFPTSEKHTLDRIDVDGDYSKENCRWVTVKEQAINRRNNVKIKYKNKILTLSQIEEETGIYNGVIRQRLIRGWNIELAVTKPVHKKTI